MKRNKQSVKLIVMSLFCMMAATPIIAQVEKVSDSTYTFDKKRATVYATDEQLVQGIGWVRSHFLDNWYFEFQGGKQLYYGVEDRLGPLMDRLTNNVEVKMGRWVFPMMGFRVGMGYGNAHGFLSKDTYNAYPGAAYGWGECEGTLGGYYWTYNDELYIQKWKYYYAGIDLVFNLSYAKMYDPNRPFTTWLYMGPDVYIGLCEGYNGPAGMVDPSVDPNRAAEFHVGLMENYRLNEQWNLFADIRVSAMHRTFDREWINGLERPLDVADPMLNFHIGATYNFHFRSEAKRTEWYRRTIDSSATITTTVPHHIYTAHQVSVNIINYMDTIYAYDTIDEFSAEYDSLLVHRARKRAENVVDSLRQAFEVNCQEATLDDILGKHLVPYEMVFFELDKWNILDNEEIKIARMASIMRAFPDMKFLLIGSADSKTGTIKRNQFLSENRSDVVYERLVNVYGIDPDQLKQVYMGGILDFEPYQLNRATVIIMDHPKVMEEFNRLKAERKAGGSSVTY